MCCAKLLYLPRMHMLAASANIPFHHLFPLLCSLKPGIDIDLVVVIRQVQMPDSTLLGQHNHADNSSGAAIPLDGLGERHLDEVDGLLLLHVLLPVLVGETVDVC